jgi:hypothetical protein
MHEITETLHIISLQGVISMHPWTLLVFKGMPVQLCRMQMYQTTGQIC